MFINSNEDIIWYAKYIYPDTLMMSENEYDKWEERQLKNLEVNYPEIYKSYTYSQTKYWKLNKSHNILINRNKEWFNNALPKFRNIWNKILYYREHKDEIEEDIINKRLYSQQILDCKTDKIIVEAKSININKSKKHEFDFFD